MRLTDRASAAATSPLGHYSTFLKTEAPASCMRLLGCAFSGAYLAGLVEHLHLALEPTLQSASLQLQVVGRLEVEPEAL